MGPFLSGLPRLWWSIDLPGVRPHGVRPATYSAFDWRQLPPVPTWVTGDYSWLASSPAHPGSSLAELSDAVTPDLAGWHDLAGQAADMQMPADFLDFARDPALRSHLRSVTGCYFDLGECAVEVPGGRLVHFLSDSQGVLHWLMFAGTGEQAVVTTAFPAGFSYASQDLKVDPGLPAYEICADTFLEFIWRFWIENEIWLALTSKTHPLAAAQQHYVNHYSHHEEMADPGLVRRKKERRRFPGQYFRRLRRWGGGNRSRET